MKVPTNSISSKPTRLLGLLLAMCAVIGGPARAAENRTLRYTILMNGQRAGLELDTLLDNHGLDSQFEYNDRGRGPKVHARYVFDPSRGGLPVQVDVSGVNYLKAPVDEHFVADLRGARWHSTAEQGQSASKGFYVSNDGPQPAERALLARTLLVSPERRLALLPGGSAELSSPAETIVASHGHTMHVREMTITGLDLTPQAVWIDDAGDLFAQAGKWMAVVREGWEDVNDALVKIQREADEQRYRRIAGELSRRPGGPLVFEHVRVFDAERATMLSNQTVVVQGKQIVSVGSANEVHVPSGAERIDGRDKTLLPGLFDMHVHVQSPDGLLNIASGVTTVRDLGNDIDSIAHLQAQWDSGAAIGPRLWKAGFIDGRGPYQAPTGLYADTRAEALDDVTRYADLGYVQIKIYSSLNPSLVPAIVEAAHQRGLRVSGHVPQGMTAAEFVRAGADELQHINFVLLNFLADKVHDTRTSERLTAAARYGAEVDPDSPAVRDFIRLLLAHHTTVDVTLVAFEGDLTARPGEISNDYAPIYARLPPQVQRQAREGGLPVTSENDARYRESFATMLRMTKKMFDAGVPILAGTDTMAGVMLHRELELEVRAGIPPLRALQNATWLAARVLKQDAMLGSIHPGKAADLLLVDGDPGVDIRDVRRGRMVLKDGVVFDPAAVYAAVGLKAQPARTRIDNADTQHLGSRSEAKPVGIP